MPKLLSYNIPSKTKKELLKEFYDFVSSLNRQETEEFFQDFLTPSEKIIFTRRLRVTKMLLQGFNQVDIRKKLGVGVSTVQFVQNWIKDELGKRKINKKKKNK